MKNKVRIFSAEEKTKIVLELLKEDITLSQLSSKYEVNAKSIRNWKSQFVEKY
ncbi:transposase [Candidatus Tisiphia endosymbiont of Nedyus quadrimaculatus]|uniref:transposase n=1 Tax=Candidatus Tisiphia endosymbiont of Nedyus quadrimaculatus TaxID=3139332 RepID=UPI00345E69EF